MQADIGDGHLFLVTMLIIYNMVAMIIDGGVKNKNDANGSASNLPLLWQESTLHNASFRDTNGVCISQCKL